MGGLLRDNHQATAKKKEYVVYYSDLKKTVTIRNWLMCIAAVKQFTLNC